MIPDSSFATVVCNFVGTIRSEKFNGDDYVVAPCVMLVEGVLEGSDGAGFYPAEENRQAVQAWNTKPVVYGHPKDDGGNFVSVANARVLEKYQIGMVLNTEHDDSTKKLKTEVWFNVKKTDAVDPQILNNLRQGKKIEVSTGLFRNRDNSSGVFNGRGYTWIARNQQPDHLAVLMSEKGACSIEDGAGLLANQKNDEIPQRIRINLGIGGVVSNIGMTLEETYSHVRRALAVKHGKPGTSWNGYIEDIYPMDNTVIYYNGEDGSNSGQLMRHDYTLSSNTIQLKGDPVPVRRRTVYDVVGNSSKEISKMAATFNRASHIQLLINSSLFTVDDRTHLETLPDAVLEKIQPPSASGNTTPPTPTPVTFNQLVENAPQELKEALIEMASTHAQTRSDLIQKITANKSNTFTPDQLAGMSTPVLKGIASLATTTGSNVVGNNSQALGNLLGQFLTPPGVVPPTSIPVTPPTNNAGNNNPVILPLPGWDTKAS